PRSGTTWLQLLLSRHNGVLSNAENSLFSSYISHLNKVWEYEKNSKFNRGLPKFFSEMKFQEFLSQFINEAYSYFVPTIEGDELTKKIFLDKNPANVFHIELILKYIPHAKFIHIIRDGRDVV